MKKNYFLFFLFFILSFGKGFSQADSCVILGCAANYGTQTTNNSLPLLPGTPGSCYSPNSYSQIFWQFFYADPLGPTGDFTQTYTPTNGATPLDIDWVVYDMGTSSPPALSCPIDRSSWTELICNGAGTNGVPAGPGTDGTFTPVLNHYYAIGIIINPIGADPSPDPNFQFTVSNPQIGGFNLGGGNCASIVLPVKLTSFEARIANCGVNLTWTVSAETNFKNYEVQFSTNGTNFQTTGIIPAQLLSNNSNQKYSYQHNSPQQGNLYYRLKMVDIDGKFSYSKIIALKFDCNRSKTIVYPNPVTNVLNVNITNAQNNITVASLFDSYGKRVYTGNMISGTNAINMANFSKGIYLLHLKNNTEVQNIKIIK